MHVIWVIIIGGCHQVEEEDYSRAMADPIEQGEQVLLLHFKGITIRLLSGNGAAGIWQRWLSNLGSLEASTGSPSAAATSPPGKDRQTSPDSS